MSNYLNLTNYRYSFPAKAAWERKYKRSAEKLFSDSIIDGQLTDCGLQDYIWIMSYGDHKGNLDVAEIDIPDERMEEVTKAVFDELNRWIQHKAEILKNKTEAAK